MSATRYDSAYSGSMYPRVEGGYVKFEDYQILEDKVRELESQFEKPKSWVRPGGA